MSETIKVSTLDSAFSASMTKPAAPSVLAIALELERSHG